MSHKRKNKCQWTGSGHQPWFIANLRRQRMRTKMRRKTRQQMRRKAGK